MRNTPPLNTYSTLLKLLVAVTVFATTDSLADIYKHVDEYGNISYSDEPPTPKAKPIKLKPLNTAPAIEIRSQQAPTQVSSDQPIDRQAADRAPTMADDATRTTTPVMPAPSKTLTPSPTPAPQAKRDLPRSSAGPYKLRIASPKQDFRYGPDDKILNVIILSKQKLDETHQFQLYVDGKPQGQTTRLNNINFTFSPEMRGQITLIVAVVDALGTRIETSAPVTILVNRNADSSISNQ